MNINKDIKFWSVEETDYKVSDKVYLIYPITIKSPSAEIDIITFPVGHEFKIKEISDFELSLNFLLEDEKGNYIKFGNYSFFRPVGLKITSGEEVVANNSIFLWLWSKYKAYKINSNNKKLILDSIILAHRY